MVEYVTLEQLRAIRSELTTAQAKAIVERAERRSPARSTFLSYASVDSEFLPVLIHILEGHGADVYVDKKDPSLPPTTSRETAKALRARIEECEKFVLFATPKSMDSRWIPWELGIADGLKRARSVAIFPSPENAYDYAWSKREYLGVYDRIVWGDLQEQESKVWMVLNQEEWTGQPLRRWLRN